MRGDKSRTLQPMVAAVKIEAKKEFARLLGLELDRVGIVKDRGRITSVWEKLKERGKQLVTREQVRKWIRGIDIPDQTNLQLLCKRLNLDLSKLQIGGSPGKKTKVPGDLLYAQLIELWTQLPNDAARAQLLGFARVMLGERLPPSDSDDTKARETSRI